MSMQISEKGKKAIPHQFLLKVQAVYDSLKTAEMKAANLILESPEFVSNATIGEAADRADCSQATYVRLAHRLGYGGFPELKAQLKVNEGSQTQQLYQAISVDDSDNDIVKKVFQACIQALSDTLNVFDMNKYSQAADAFCQAGKVMFCGVGDSSAIAQAAYLKFMRTGIEVFYSPDPNAQLVTASHMGKGDVLVAISHMGRSKSVVDLVKYAHSIGVTVIAITNFPVSPLSKNADMLLLTAAFGNHIGGEVMSKRLAELCIIECLYVNTLIRNGKTVNSSIEKANTALEMNII